MVDGNGLPIRIMLSPGQASDKQAAAVLIQSLTRTRDLVADRGYDARSLIDLAAARGTRAHIPTQKDRRQQRSIDPRLYRERNLVERFFLKIKHFRRIATRYEQTPRAFMSLLCLVSAFIWTE